MKIALIGDPHFNIKDGSNNAFKYQKHFYEDILFPNLKEYGVENVLFLGDMFHNRRSINLRILSEVTQLIKSIPIDRESGEVRGILGNHDFYFRNSYDIATVRDLDMGVDFGSSKFYVMNACTCLMIHWHNTNEELQETLDEICASGLSENVEYIFGHFSFNGYKLNNKVINMNEEDAHDIDVTKRFPNLKKIFSGHFHTPSEQGLVKYVGVPYHLTWSEANSTLGFHILDTDTHELIFIENPHKAFEYIRINEHTKKTPEEIINSIETHDYRKLFKIVYSGGTYEPIARYIYNQILLREHDAQLIDESLYNVDDDNINVDDALSIDDLIKIYFNSSTLIPSGERDSYYDLFKMFYDEAKNSKENLEF